MLYMNDGDDILCFGTMCFSNIIFEVCKLLRVISEVMIYVFLNLGLGYNSSREIQFGR